MCASAFDGAMHFVASDFVGGGGGGLGGTLGLIFCFHVSCGQLRAIMAKLLPALFVTRANQPSKHIDCVCVRGRGVAIAKQTSKPQAHRSPYCRSPLGHVSVCAGFCWVHKQ